MKIAYTPTFGRQFHTLDAALQEDALEKINLFKETSNHRQLKVHKLHGPLRGRFSFSVNYKYRIVFAYLSKDEVILHAIGDHDVYR